MKKEIKVIACIGDSITKGFLSDDEEPNSYPMRLELLLGDRAVVGGFGRSGSGLWSKGKTPYATTREFNMALSWKADVYIICIGANDIVHPVDNGFVDCFLNDYRQLIGTIRKNNPEAAILVATIPPIPGHFVDNQEERVRKLNVAARQVAKDEGALLVELYKDYLGKTELYEDDLHPNKEGAELLAKEVYNVLERII